MTVIQPEAIERAFNASLISDLERARAVIAFGQEHECGYDEIVAAAVRYGTAQGRINAKLNDNRKAQFMLQQIRELKRKFKDDETLPRRIREGASWIDDPDTLHELAAFMEGRAARLEAGEAEIKPTTFYAATQRFTNKDGYSDGTTEV